MILTDTQDKEMPQFITDCHINVVCPLNSRCGPEIIIFNYKSLCVCVSVCHTHIMSCHFEVIMFTLYHSPKVEVEPID